MGWKKSETAPSKAGIARGWLWRGALLLPFVVCLVVVMATGWAFPVFWGGDESEFHWPLVQRFAAQLPRPDLRDPGTATGPFFHLLEAAVIRATGPSLGIGRAVNAIISALGALALFGMLRRRPFNQPDTVAALLTALFAGSGYYFGYSFRVLTDNLAVVLTILAMGRLFRTLDHSEDDPGDTWVRCFCLGCLFVGLAMVTRQNYAFLGLTFGGTLLLLPGVVPRRRVLGLFALLVAALPLAGLVVLWGGMTPPSPYFRTHHAGHLLNLHSMALPLLVLSAYAPFFSSALTSLGRSLGNRPLRHLMLPLIAAGAGLFAVAWGPLDHPIDTTRQFAGWIHNVASRLPTLHGNSILYWVGLPWGAFVAVERLQSTWSRRAVDPRALPTALFLVGVLVGSLVNNYAAQKYSDGLILLFLIWDTPPASTLSTTRRAAWVGLLGCFIAYHVAYSRLANNERPPAAAPAGEISPPTGTTLP